jgi:hypothetical protein
MLLLLLLLITKMIYRIVEKTDLNGNIKFYPQQRKLFLFWMPFIKAEVFPVEICFDSFESANKFIVKRKEQPKRKIYYV